MPDCCRWRWFSRRALRACTTTEGTNALSDVGTFEREVMTETMQGIGVLDREEKDENIQPRAPLVLPKDRLAAAAGRPEADSPPRPCCRTIRTTSRSIRRGLTDDDIKRLRNARVVDLRTLDGRPLTDAEAQQLTARMHRRAG